MKQKDHTNKPITKATQYPLYVYLAISFKSGGLTNIKTNTPINNPIR